MSERSSPQSPHRARHTRAVAECATRDNIVRSALSLFAKHGIDGVSLRQIVAAAGQSNPSAIHYHFHSKDGLVQAVIRRAADDMAPLQHAALDQLFGLRDRGEPLDARTIVGLAISPFVTLYASSAEGRMAVRFISRLTWYQESSGQGALFEQLWNYWRDVVVLLHEAVPELPIDILMSRGLLMGCSLIHGLADLSLLAREPVLIDRHHMPSDPARLLEHYLDFALGGLIAPCHEQTALPAATSTQVA